MFSESEAYERFMGRWSRQLAPPFLEFVALGDDQQILDVGSGTGALADAIMSKSSFSRVVGLDPSESYVERARSRATRDGVVFEVGDAQALRFGDETFDRTLSLLVVNFISDPTKALEEMVRVTRPGGIVGAAVWDYDEGMQMLRVFWDTVVSRDGAAHHLDERNMPFCRPAELRSLWKESGLGEVEVQEIVIDLAFESFDDYWAPFLEGQGPAGGYVARLPEESREDLRKALYQRVCTELPSAPIVMKARAWAVKGTRSD